MKSIYGLVSSYKQLSGDDSIRGEIKMNINTLNKLQYNELKEIVKSYCVSGLGKNLIDKLQPSSNLNVVESRLNETSEGRALLDTAHHIPLEGIFNIKDIIENVEKGAVIEPEDLTKLCNFLRGCRKIKEFMKGKEFYASTLSSYGNSITEFKSIEEEIEFSIRGIVVDSNASKELRKIRRYIENAEGKIQQQLERSGCTQVSEMQGCDINKTKAENAKAGFGTAPVATPAAASTYNGTCRRL